LGRLTFSGEIFGRVTLGSAILGDRSSAVSRSGRWIHQSDWEHRRQASQDDTKPFQPWPPCLRREIPRPIRANPKPNCNQDTPLPHAKSASVITRSSTPRSTSRTHALAMSPPYLRSMKYRPPAATARPVSIRNRHPVFPQRRSRNPIPTTTSPSTSNPIPNAVTPAPSPTSRRPHPPTPSVRARPATGPR